MCVCAMLMFMKVYNSNKFLKSTAGTGSAVAQSRIRKVGVRLMLLLFVNLLYWIPIITTAGILLTNIGVHDDVLSWLAAFIIPISATADPFLYNIHMFKNVACK